MVLHDVVFHGLPTDGSLTREMLGLRDSDYTFAAWRDDVGAALRAQLGGDVTDGNKAFNVRAAAQRLEADVAVFLEHRRYNGKKTPEGTWHYDEGVEMRPREAPSQRTINWPKQHENRGAAKNKATNSRFKRVVRIFKQLRADMAVQGDARAEERCRTGEPRSLSSASSSMRRDRCFNLQAGG